MSEFLKSVGAVTLMLSITAALFLLVCGVIEWYFTWVFSIFPIKAYFVPVILIHLFLFGAVCLGIGTLGELIKRKDK